MLFAFIGTELRPLEVLRSFEVETFLQDKLQNSRNAVAFREFFVPYWRKVAVQNRLITMVHRPCTAGFSALHIEIICAVRHNSCRQAIHYPVFSCLDLAVVTEAMSLRLIDPHWLRKSL